MYNHTLDPTLLDIGPVEIRWYGLMYVIAFIFLYFFLTRFSSRFDIKLDKNEVIDFLLYSAIGMIIFSRLFEVFYYNPSYYLEYPLKSLAIWEGGLSFHGGLLGVVIVGYIFCRVKKIPFLRLADLVAIPAAIGLMLGRIGNFINGELVGRLTDVPWCFNFPGYEGCRHPSQLYEAFKNFLIFGILWQFKGKKPDGFVFFLFMILYAILRSFIEEYYRLPQEYIMGFTEGQFLSLFMFIIGIVGMLYIYKTNFPTES